ncbi:MAG TPA: pantoate--beta-alanine ligase [Saprospiraceae bacterium]|nr:pantoate--beta-alanine ligase [Saprospiraceae bacterium]HMX87352.1 pantoate--beta-alanine ligase [Saprospiraceae bacterium]HMZ39179.1 pantoate--beta-alanine ligase [Saprospiraceae bacterium]HNA64713.1 pantoate--beta-alanine ligase [Saprospiraceae bacterium]HNB29875.1 pantoate--beta-alanine ligase [Saprospiraceae bacterium]
MEASKILIATDTLKFYYCTKREYLRPVKIFRTVQTFEQYLSAERNSGHTIAFVPTMGALHEGHISLIRIGLEHATCVVCSIFVNPTQFNQPEDLKQYPRTPDEDIALLFRAGCHALFMPEAEEIYPGGRKFQPEVELNGADKVMEGHFRPGHFDGMLMVVYRLLEITNPDFLVMGQKDFQQYSLVGMMISQLRLNARLIIGPTRREPDGLAMSSRNRRLEASFRKKAPIIYQALQYARARLGQLPVRKIESEASAMIDQEGFRTEYFQIVDGQTLLPLESADQASHVVACVACWAGEVRLIDNLSLKP